MPICVPLVCFCLDSAFGETGNHPMLRTSGCGFESCRARQYLRGVMAAYESPKLLVAVRVRAGMPIFKQRESINGREAEIDD